MTTTTGSDVSSVATTGRPRTLLRKQRPRTISASAGFFARWWVPCLVLPMIVASDYKFRHRAAASALGGRPDSQVLMEVGVYALVASYLVLRRGRAPRLARKIGRAHV